MSARSGLSGEQTKLLAEIEASLGMSLSAYRPEQVWNRVVAFLSVQRLEWHMVGPRMRSDPLFVRDLQHYLTIHVTSFYRDPACWQALEDLVRASSPRPCWEVWCAGVSTGAEAISAVGLFQGIGLDVRVLATDVDAVALDEAKAGVYGAPMLSRMPSDVRDRLMSPVHGGSSYAVLPEVRRRILYRRQDLLGDAYPERRFDLILCRNVLIYFAPEDRARVIRTVVDRLVTGGLLLLSATEVVLSPETYGLGRIGPALYERI